MLPAVLTLYLLPSPTRETDRVDVHIIGVPLLQSAVQIASAATACRVLQVNECFGSGTVLVGPLRVRRYDGVSEPSLLVVDVLVELGGGPSVEASLTDSPGSCGAESALIRAIVAEASRDKGTSSPRW